MKGFREFIMRGNVIELAVAVIIGGAFTAIFNADEINKAVWQLGPVSLGVGSVLAAIINFLLIAIVIYFLIITPMNKLNEQLYVRKHGHKPSEAEVETAASETELLAEIRDLLAAREGK